MDEEGEEDGEAEGGVCVVGCVGYEAFGDFVEGDCAAGLQAYGKEDVGWDVVVVLVDCVIGVGGCGVRSRGRGD